MKLSMLFVSLICLLPALAHSQYGAFGAVPDCNCGSGKGKAETQSNSQQLEVSVSTGQRPSLTQSEINALEKRMSAKIAKVAGREADPSALDQSDAIGFAVPVIQVTLDSQGNVIGTEVIRWPSNDAARGTVDIAISAIHNAAPYRKIANGIQGLKLMQTFIFKNNHKFYLRALGN